MHVTINWQKIRIQYIERNPINQFFKNFLNYRYFNKILGKALKTMIYRRENPNDKKCEKKLREKQNIYKIIFSTS